MEAPERIETKIDVETAIDIPLDEVTLYKFYPEGPERIEFAVFKRVQADMASVEQCLRENTLPASHTIDEKGSPYKPSLDAIPVPGKKALLVSRDPELREFLNGLRPCSENDAWRMAEAHFDAAIARKRIRALRSVKGKVGRPRKSLQENLAGKTDGGVLKKAKQNKELEITPKSGAAGFAGFCGRTLSWFVVRNTNRQESFYASTDIRRPRNAQA